MTYWSSKNRANLHYFFKNQFNVMTNYWLWFCSPKSDNKFIEDKLRQGHPDTCTNQENKQYLVQNLHVTCLEINSNESVIIRRFHAINFIKLLGKLVPYKKMWLTKLVILLSPTMKNELIMTILTSLNNTKLKLVDLRIVVQNVGQTEYYTKKVRLTKLAD